MNAKQAKNVGRKLSRILRHDPPKTVDGSGWVPVADLASKLGHPVALEDLQRVVDDDNKGRFQVCKPTKCCGNPTSLGLIASGVAFVLLAEPLNQAGSNTA